MAKKMKRFFILVPVVILSFLTQSEGQTNNRTITSSEDMGVIVEHIIERQEQQRNQITDMQFHGHSIFREMDAQGNLKDELLIDRIVYEKGDLQTAQYLFMSANGKMLNEKQMAKEIDDWEKKGKKRGTTKMPFDQRYQADYIYTSNGRIDYEGTVVEIIGFEPKENSDGYIKGIAYIHPTEYAVLRIESMPAKLPGVIKEMEMIYTYKKEQGYWLPASFGFSLRLKVQFVLTFVHNTYTLADTYFDFLLNQGLPDSLFTVGN